MSTQSHLLSETDALKAPRTLPPTDREGSSWRIDQSRIVSGTPLELGRYGLCKLVSL